MATAWTSAFGRACGVLLDASVRWLALARINPNVLTFHGTGRQHHCRVSVWLRQRR